MGITDTFLSEKEVVDLTERRTKPAQVRALKAMGIEHRVRPDNSIAILRAHIIKVFDGGSESKSKPKKITPNWDAI